MLAESLDDERRGALQCDFVAFHEVVSSELGIAAPNGYFVTPGTRC